MIEINGSQGEGGGQILRTSIALSAVTGEDVRIRNIRANRPSPGLAPSHVTSIDAVARICDGEVDGLFAGSKEIVFRPGQLTGGRFEFDVGTAGSISLVLQSCLVPAALSKARVVIQVNGGTDVRWAPPIDFMRLVHLPILGMFGPSCDIEVVSRGFYPEGGGEVVMVVSPESRLAPVDLASRGEVLRIEGVACAQNLPEHVITRTKHAALKRLVDFRQVKVDSDLRKGRSTGAGVVLCAVCENTFLGASVLGEKGVRAEEIGDGCAQDLLETLRSGATVDEHMLDQILPYMALSEGPSRVLAEEMTGHAETNISVIETFLGRRFETQKTNGLLEIRAA
jgi:RNA 3'-phosphate cyclase